MDKEIERFWLVWDVTAGKVVGDFDSATLANKFASDKAGNDIGNTFIVFEPKEAYRAKATVSPVFLAWPSELAPHQAPVT